MKAGKVRQRKKGCLNLGYGVQNSPACLSRSVRGRRSSLISLDAIATKAPTSALEAEGHRLPGVPRAERVGFNGAEGGLPEEIARLEIEYSRCSPLRSV